MANRSFNVNLQQPGGVGGRSYAAQGPFDGATLVDANKNPGVTQIYRGPLERGLHQAGAPPYVEPKASDALEHNVPSVIEMISQATPKRIAEILVQHSVAKEYPHFQLLPPRLASESELAGLSVGIFTIGPQLPTEVPEGVSARTISHKYETKLMRHKRVAQAMRFTRDSLKTPSGQAIFARYVLALAANASIMGQILITSALLRCKDWYAPYRQKYLPPGSFSGDTLAQKVTEPIGAMHRGPKMIYKMLDFVRTCATRSDSASFTHILCTSTVFALLSYGSSFDTEVFRRGEKATQILEQGGTYFKKNGAGGMTFIEEPEYDFMKVGREGSDKTNMLKRRIEVGRYYTLTSENMVSKSCDISFQQSADLGFLNMNSGDGVVERQSYLDILHACCAFDPMSGELSPAYNRLIANGGELIKQLADQVQARVPSNAEGACVDPFINWTPHSNPSIVKYFGEQDIAYTSIDDQEMIVEKVCCELRKKVTPEVLQSAKFVLEKAAQWHCPSDYQYAEAFFYATFHINRLKGNTMFDGMTVVPQRTPGGLLTLGEEEGDVVCHSVASPGVMSLVKINGKSNVGPAGYETIRAETNAKCAAVGAGNSVHKENLANIVHTTSLVRNEVPDYTTSGNISIALNTRMGEVMMQTGGEDAVPASQLGSLAAADRFGVRAIMDCFPGFSRYQNMEALCRVEPGPTSLVSKFVHDKLNEGMMAMNTIMGFLAQTFSCSAAPNYFFDWKSCDFDQASLNSLRDGSSKVRGAGVENILFGKRYPSAFQRALDDYGFANGSTEKTIGGLPRKSLHEENYGLNVFSEYITGSRVTKLLTLVGGPPAARANAAYARVASYGADVSLEAPVAFNVGTSLVPPGNVNAAGVAITSYSGVQMTRYAPEGTVIQYGGGLNAGAVNEGPDLLGGARFNPLLQNRVPQDISGGKQRLLNVLTGRDSMDVLVVPEEAGERAISSRNLVRAMLHARDHVLTKESGVYLTRYGQLPGGDRPVLGGILQAPFPDASAYGQNFWTIYEKVKGNIPDLTPAEANTVTAKQIMLAKSVIDWLGERREEDGVLNEEILGLVQTIYERSVDSPEFKRWEETVERTMRGGEDVEMVDVRPAQGNPLSINAAGPAVADGRVFPQGVEGGTCIQFGLSLSAEYFKKLRNRLRSIISSCGIPMATIEGWASTAIPAAVNAPYGDIDPAAAELSEVRTAHILPIAGRYLKSIYDCGEAFSHVRPASGIAVEQGNFGGVAGRNPSRHYISNFRLLPAFAAADIDFKKLSFMDDIAPSYEMTEYLDKLKKAVSSGGNKRKRGVETQSESAWATVSGLTMTDGDLRTYNDPQELGDLRRRYDGEFFRDRSGGRQPAGSNDPSVPKPDFTIPWWALRMGEDVNVLTGESLLKRCVTLAYCGTRVHRASFEQMYKNNIPGPIGFLCADLFITLVTSGLIFVAPANGATGLLSYGIPDMREGDDADRKMVNFTLTWHMNAMVIDDRNVFNWPDAVFEGYCGGGSGRLIRTGVGSLSAHQQNSSTFVNMQKLPVDFNYANRERRGERFVFPLGFSRKKSELNDYICFDGTVLSSVSGLAHWVPRSLLDRSRQGQIDMAYDSGFLGLEIFRFHGSRRNNREFDEKVPFIESVDLLRSGNMVACTANQWAYCPSTDKYTHKCQEGTGPLGSLDPGCMVALRGGAQTLQELKNVGSGRPLAIA